MIQFARFIAFDGVDDKSNIRNQAKEQNSARLGYGFRGFLDAFSLRNEKAAWALVKKTAMDELKDYPSTISEDKDLLE